MKAEKRTDRRGEFAIERNGVDEWAGRKNGKKVKGKKSSEPRSQRADRRCEEQGKPNEEHRNKSFHVGTRHRAGPIFFI